MRGLDKVAIPNCLPSQFDAGVVLHFVARCLTLAAAVDLSGRGPYRHSCLQRPFHKNLDELGVQTSLQVEPSRCKRNPNFQVFGEHRASEGRMNHKPETETSSLRKHADPRFACGVGLLQASFPEILSSGTLALLWPPLPLGHPTCACSACSRPFGGRRSAPKPVRQGRGAVSLKANASESWRQVCSVQRHSEFPRWRLEFRLGIWCIQTRFQ